MKDELIGFYLGTRADHAGRMIEDIWRFDHEELEYHHDFIQWLFPLEVPSPVNPEAPTLDAATREEFSRNAELSRRLLVSLDLMLDFYGLERGEGGILPGAAFEVRRDKWLTRGNHNHLRLTRIIHCLALCGQEVLARQLVDCLLAIVALYPERVQESTPGFWRDAVRV